MLAQTCSFCQSDSFKLAGAISVVENAWDKLDNLTGANSNVLKGKIESVPNKNTNLEDLTLGCQGLEGPGR